jgi:hypothetical protein
MKKMKWLTKISAAMLFIVVPILISGCSYTESQSAMNQTAGPNDYNIQDLNNYGEWIYISPYGDCWRPYVVSDWMPFENGHWAYSEGNWTWISYEPFGWIVYHYGNWYDDPIYGWVWIPSNDAWSPARVMWYDYGNYIGWAPLPPPGVNYGNPWEINEHHYWNVVRRQDFTQDDVRDFEVRNPVRNEMGGRSMMNGQPERKPPSRSRIESSIGSRVNEVKIPRETVKLPRREIKRMHLPPEEARRVKQHSPRVRRRALVSREKFHAQHHEARNAREKSRRSR